MEITQELKTEIEKIINGLEYPKDFKCEKTEFEDLAKTQIFQDGELVECFEELSQLFKFSFNFRHDYFKYPLPSSILPRTLADEYSHSCVVSMRTTI